MTVIITLLGITLSLSAVFYTFNFSDVNPLHFVSSVYLKSLPEKQDHTQKF